MPRSGGSPGDGPRSQAPQVQFDTVAANTRLTEAGYSALGLLRQDGPCVMLDATNPQGETVTLQLDRAGEVLRETAR